MKGSTSKKRTLFLLFFTNLLSSLGLSIIIPIIALLFLDKNAPVFETGLTEGELMLLLGILKATYPFFQFFGAPILSTISDKLGRRPVLIYSILGTFIGYVLFILGIIYQDLSLIFIGRIIDGITGGNISVTYSCVADISESKEKTKNFGLIGMAFGLGFIIGPVIGGLTSDPEIVSWFNYSTPFIIAAVLSLLNMVLIIRYFPETNKNMRNISIRSLVSFDGIITGFKLKQLRPLMITIFLFFSGFTFYTQFYEVYLINKFSFTQSDIGPVFGYIGFWIVISQGVFARIFAKYFKPEKIIPVTLLMLSVFLVSLIFPNKIIYLLLLLPFVSIMHGLSQPNLLSVFSNNVPDDIQGKMLGVIQSLQSIGLAITPVVAGIFISFHPNYPILIASALTFISVIVFIYYIFTSAKNRKD